MAGCKRVSRQAWGGRCPASEGVEAVGRSDSVARTDYPLPCSVDIARLKSTSVVTHGHERFAAKGEGEEGRLFVKGAVSDELDHTGQVVGLHRSHKQLCLSFSSIPSLLANRFERGLLSFRDLILYRYCTRRLLIQRERERKLV